MDQIAFSDLITNIPFPVAIFDLDLKIIAASDLWIRAGRLHDKGWLGKRIDDVCPESDDWKEKHRQAQNGELLQGEELLVSIPIYEEKQFVNWQIRPWRKNDGNIGGTVMSVQNVSERVRSRLALEKLLEQAEEAKRIKSDFLSNISHELRTPLNGILGFTSLAKDTDAENIRSQYLDLVKASASKLLNIVNNVLDFSNLDSGTLNLEIRQIPLCELVRQVVDVASSPIQQKGLEMLVRFYDPSEVSIHVDALRIKQILLILLDNACKFTREGEVELGIRMLRLPDHTEKGRMRFSVRDTGIGIETKQANRIMEAFAQAESAATKSYEGAGLGLAIVRNLLKMMESELEFISTPDKGSEFFFDLDTEMRFAEVSSPIRLDFLKRILILDANQSACEIMAEILSFHNIPCDHVTSDTEVFDMIKAGNVYDAVIVEHDMPHLNGIAIARKLKLASQGKMPPIIVTYAPMYDFYQLQNDDEKLISSLVAKPVRYQDLILALSDLYTGTQQNTDQVSSGIPDLPHDTERQPSILMVEDNAVNMMLLKTVLRKLMPHAELVEAGNGLVAVSMCQQKLPDLVFMDVQMPVMNGLEATRIIRSMEHAKHLPIIALTAGNERGARENCLQAGMDEFVTKPYTASEIKDLLKRFDVLA